MADNSHNIPPRSRDIFRNLIEHISAVTYMALPDQKSSTLYVSPQIKDLIGFSQEEMQADADLWFNRLHPDDSRRVSAEIANCYSSGKPLSIEYRMLSRDGRVVWLRDEAVIERDAAGRPSMVHGVMMDISRLKKAEETLIASEKRSREFFDYHLYGYGFCEIVTNDSGKPVDFITLELNKALEIIIGVTAEAIVGRRITEIFPQASNSPLFDVVGKVAATGKPAHLEFESTVLNRWLEISVFSPNPGQFAGIFADITERKRAERALKDSEERFRNLFQDAPVGIYRTTLDGHILLANPTLLRMLGYSSIDDLAVRNLEQAGFEPQYARKEFKDRIDKEGEVRGLEAAWVKCDGSTVYIRENARAIRGKDGSILYYEGTVEDITEKRRTEKALQKSQEAYRDLVENVNDILFEIDSNEILTYVSPAVKNLLGYDSAELVGRSYTPLIHIEDLAGIRQSFVDVLNNRLSPSEFRILTKAGEIRWVHTSSRPILDGNNITGIRGVLVDITESRLAQEALRQNEEFNRAVIEHSPLGVSVRSRTGKLLNCNKAWQRIWNKTDEEIARLMAAEPPELGFDRRDDYLLQWQPRIREVYEHGGYLHVPEANLLYHQEGGQHWVSQYFYAIKDKKGIVDKVVILTEDITERKRAEMALRESEERYRAIWENSPVGICLTDRNGIYHYVNKTYCGIYGYSREELIGQPFFKMILPPGHPRQDGKEFRGRFDNPQPTPLRETDIFVKKDGQQVFIQHTSDFVWEGSLPKFMVSMNIDISEKRLVENALRESEEKYRLLIENAAEVVVNIDRDGKILVINQSAAKYLNSPPAELVGKSLQDVFPQGLASQLMQAIARVIDTGIPLTTERQIPIQDEFRWFRNNLQPIAGSDGRITSVLIISTDITGLKQVEALNEARLKLLQRLRKAKNIDECLGFGCQAIMQAGLFKRAVLTLHNEAREITHLGQVGLDDDTIIKAREAPAPSLEIARRITQEKFRLSHSFFIPVESGLFSKSVSRHVPQQEAARAWSDAWQIGDEMFVPVMSNDNRIEGWLSVDTPIDGRRPSKDVISYLEEIIDITTKQVHEINSLDMLKDESRALQEKHIAFREVLAHIEEDKMEIKQKIGANVTQILIPALNKLVRKDGSINQTYYNLLKSGLPNLVSASNALVQAYAMLSPREREICNLIRNDSTSKEIAAALNISIATVQKHRESIRRKLALTSKNVNLINFLKGI